VGQSLKGFDVVAVMERIKELRGVVQKRIQVDNGSEFISKALDRWAYENEVTLDFSRPGNRLITRSSNHSTAAFVTSA
jgi:putative transposase